MARRTLHAEIRGSETVKRLLEEMADRATGVQAAWPGVGDVIADHLTRQFDEEGKHFYSRPWRPLSPPYLAWKLRKGYDPRRLHQTGAMRRSLTSRPMDVEEYGDLSARFGTSDFKAPFHQRGTRRMPARPIIRATEDMADDINQVLARYIFQDRLDP